MECQACMDKGPGWPGHLDFANLAPHQACCAWCGGSRQVVREVAEVFERLIRQPSLLSVRAITLTARAIESRNNWTALQHKKRPKGQNENEWNSFLSRTKTAAEQAELDARNAVKQALENENVDEMRRSIAIESDFGSSGTAKTVGPNSE